MMNNLDMYELEYANYLAEQEMLDKLTILSIKSKGVLTESALESINEAAMDTVMGYIKKITSNIQVAWNKFKAVITKGEYAALKKQYEQYFNSNTKIVSNESIEVCIFAELDNQLAVDMPTLNENLLDDLVSSEEFIQKHLKDLYEADKSMSEVMSSKVFKPIDKLFIDKNSLKYYINFLENYSKKVDTAAQDIQNINNTGNIAKQILEKLTNNIAQQNNPQNQNNEEQNNQQDNNVKQESFTNLADTFLYYFNEDKAFRSVNEPPKQEEQESNDKKEKKPDISKQIMTYYKVASQLLSAKMNMLNKARKTALKVISNFGSTAKQEAGGNNKKEADNKTTDNKSGENINTSDLQINI